MGMSRVMAVAAVAIAAAGCGGEDLAERIVENRVESDSGQDVDIDFDDGDVSVRTEDGEFSVDVDSDADGNVSISGSSEDGEFSMEYEGGEIVIETDEGTAVLASDTGSVPDGFPDSVPVPDGFAIELSQSISTDAGDSFVVAGTLDGDGAERGRAYIAELESAGFRQVQVIETPDGMIFGYDDGEYLVSGAVGADADSGASFLSLTVTPTQQE